MTFLAWALPALFLATWLIAERRRPITAYDRYCVHVDQELDEAAERESAERAKELFATRRNDSVPLCD